MVGSINCNKCSTVMDDAKQICPSCGRPQCHIVIPWEGKKERFHKDARRDIPFNYFLAKDQFLDMQADIKKGTFQPEKWRPEYFKERTVKQAITDWLAYCMDLYEKGAMQWSTIHGYRSRIEHVLNPEYSLAGKDLRTIKSQHLVQFRNSLPQDMTKSSKVATLNVFRNFMRWCAREAGLIDEKDIPLFPLVKHGKASREREALTQEEQEYALTLLPDDHERFRKIFTVEFDAGLRPGETCALKIKDVLPNQAIRVQRTFSRNRLRESDKAGNKGRIPLSDRAWEIIQEAITGRFPDEFVFVQPLGKRHTKNSHYDQDTLGKVWDKYCRPYIREGQVTHYEATRHSFVTNALEHLERGEVQGLARHKNAQSTAKYDHTGSRLEYLRKALNKHAVASIEDARARRELDREGSAEGAMGKGDRPYLDRGRVVND